MLTVFHVWLKAVCNKPVFKAESWPSQVLPRSLRRPHEVWAGYRPRETPPGTLSHPRASSPLKCYRLWKSIKKLLSLSKRAVCRRSPSLSDRLEQPALVGVSLRCWSKSWVKLDVYCSLSLDHKELAAQRVWAAKLVKWLLASHYSPWSMSQIFTELIIISKIILLTSKSFYYY